MTDMRVELQAMGEGRWIGIMPPPTEGQLSTLQKASRGDNGSFGDVFRMMIFNSYPSHNSQQQAFLEMGLDVDSFDPEIYRATSERADEGTQTVARKIADTLRETGVEVELGELLHHNGRLFEA